MNVLFQIRNDYKKSIAGDSIQLLMTKEYLEQLGVHVDISAQYDVNLDHYDIVHIFNIIRIKEPYRFAMNAIRQKKPYVLSTIYWNMKDYIVQATDHTYSNADWWLESNPVRYEMLCNAAALLPNSSLEMQLIKKDFHVKSKFFIIPNCSDKFFFRADSRNFRVKYRLDNFVLCVGRISSRKNQLALIHALRKTDYQLVLIGSKYHADYYEACREAANDNTLFIDEMKYENLASAYASAKVHVMPSWFETPGLSSLEAGLAGCNIVTTDRGCPREYFKNMAAYCNPASQKSIREQVEKMYRTPKSSKLSRHIFNNYIWEKAAQKTLEAYQSILKDSGREESYPSPPLI